MALRSSTITYLPGLNVKRGVASWSTVGTGRDLRFLPSSSYLTTTQLEPAARVTRSMLDVHRRRIRREQEDLDALNNRLAAAERAEAEAEQALELARAIREAAADDVSTLRSRRDAAAQQLDGIRQAYRRLFVPRLPADILQYIFEEVTYIPDRFRDEVQGGLCYNHQLAVLPWTLAAVCRPWRVQALNQPRLWTYVSYPDKPSAEDAARHLLRTKLLLRRSSRAPLDLLICWHDCEYKDNSSAQKILALLSTQAARWRTMELWLPQGQCTKDDIVAFKGPLPTLESLRFLAADDVFEEFSTFCEGFLPYAPKLRQLVFWPTAKAFRPCTAPVLSSLRHIRLWYNLSAETAWQLISAAAPSLEFLLVCVRARETNETPSPPITLPNLTSLILLDDTLVMTPHLEMMRLPKLTSLGLSSRLMRPQLGPFLTHVAPTVRTLTLGGTSMLLRPYLSTLKLLENIDTLVFDDFVLEVDFGYNVADQFFGNDADVYGDLWPRLTSVTLSTRGKLDVGEGTGILSFIRARTVDLPAQPASTEAESRARRCRLKEFNVNHPSTPRWFKAEVKRLIEA